MKKYHRLYRIYHGIKTRCLNKNCKDYKNYGERGIEICNEWLDDYENFYNWAMSNGYQDDLTIERKDVNGNYCPENCSWITNNKQVCNTRKTIKLTVFGETKILHEWALDKRCVVSEVTLLRRIKKGISPELAITSTKYKSGPSRESLTIFNETKSMRKWSQDSRCKVTYTTLCKRIKRGISPEEAIKI